MCVYEGFLLGGEVRAMRGWRVEESKRVREEIREKTAEIEHLLRSPS